MKLLTIYYHYQTKKIILTYDSSFETPAVDMTLKKAIEIANAEMNTYGFLIADIMDAETGEILAILNNED